MWGCAAREGAGEYCEREWVESDGMGRSATRWTASEWARTGTFTPATSRAYTATGTGTGSKFAACTVLASVSTSPRSTPSSVPTGTENALSVVQRQRAEQQRKRTDALEVDERDSKDSDSDDAGMDGGKGSIVYSSVLVTYTALVSWKGALRAYEETAFVLPVAHVSGDDFGLAASRAWVPRPATRWWSEEWCFGRGYRSARGEARNGEFNHAWEKCGGWK
ncbi:hypothetical protein B0H14DRAFT_3162822 [Mycena olivaceomarginata]|nr:hypothetical protein B0H14DRAFT_3162822 [Mycena olivaceomarginata]